MGKVKAALIHFSISVVIFCSIIAVTILFWYPPPYFFADGGWQMIRLAAGVDVVLGPLLTFVVFKTGKPSLKLDLSIIGIMQVSVLIWGVMLMYQQRPLYVTFALTQFLTVTEGQLAQGEHPEADLKQAAHGTPEMVYVKLPDDPKKKLALLEAGMQGKHPFYTHPDLYKPLAKNIFTVLDAGLDINKLTDNHPKYQAKLDAFLKKHGGGVKDYAYLPLRCRYRGLIMALHKPDGRVAGTIDITPPIT
ncbi:MAG: hypothetical protein P8164_12390 [Gammaproteobacteria bacterium]